MDLNQYLTAENITAADFGARMVPPMSEASLSRIRRGEQNISLDVVRRIIEASGGKVTADALVEQKAKAA